MGERIDFVVEYGMLNRESIVGFFVQRNQCYQIELEIDELEKLNNDHDEMKDRNNNLVYKRSKNKSTKE